MDWNTVSDKEQAVDLTDRRKRLAFVEDLLLYELRNSMPHNYIGVETYEETIEFFNEIERKAKLMQGVLHYWFSGNQDDYNDRESRSTRRIEELTKQLQDK